MTTAADLDLRDLSRCFQGVVPSILATADSTGKPNVTYVSQVYFVDDRHVALSRQFFNKTSRNLDQNPYACVEVYDPVTFQPYRLRLHFLRSERSGALFDTMSARIDAIASMTGMTGVFRLIGADVFEVERMERVDGFLTEPSAEEESPKLSLDGLRSEMRGLQWISERINQATDLETLLQGVLRALDEYFHFGHTLVLLYDDVIGRLVTIASRGYGSSGVGAEVLIGEGMIGTVARERRVLRMTGINAGLRYGRAVRREALAQGRASAPPEIPLPGLTDAQSALVIPLEVRDRLIGVLAVESHDPARFHDWHEAYLEIIGNQIALGIERMQDRSVEEADPPSPVGREPLSSPSESAGVIEGNRRSLVYYRADDCIFVDGEYLVRNVPGRILWKLLGEWQKEGRTDFSNRELRLDPSLGLPPVKDNLESRLILLRRRLEEKCPDIRITSTGRGRFALRVESPVVLTER